MTANSVILIRNTANASSLLTSHVFRNFMALNRNIHIFLRNFFNFSLPSLQRGWASRTLWRQSYLTYRWLQIFLHLFPDLLLLLPFRFWTTWLYTNWDTMTHLLRSYAILLHAHNWIITLPTRFSKLILCWLRGLAKWDWYRVTR